MSLQENSLKKKVIAVILCAGEGTRIKELSKEIPKPLIKVRSEGNRPILEILLNNLYQLGIERIAIVKGHLEHKIDDFINYIKRINDFSSDDLVTLHSELYKKGPLFSFLTIKEDKAIFTHNKLFLVFPGDTIFDIELLEEIIKSIQTIFNENSDSTIVFYRKINVGILKQKYQQSRKISIAHVNKSGSRRILNQIVQTKLSELTEKEIIKQIIPVFLLKYDYIKKISSYIIPDNIYSLRGIINYSIDDGEVITAVQIQSDSEFYDIDYISDLEYYEELREKEQ